MDGAGADHDRQPVVLAIENTMQMFARPGDSRAAAAGVPKPARELLGREQLPDLSNAQVVCRHVHRGNSSGPAAGEKKPPGLAVFSEISLTWFVQPSADRLPLQGMGR